MHRTLPWPFMGETGRLRTPLWSGKLRQGNSSKRLDPKTWSPGVIPVMSAEVTELAIFKDHRMGSEPFQLTDAPFHL